MCVFCERYGENGGLWYLNPKNYARQLYRRPASGSGEGEFTRAYRGKAVSPGEIFEAAAEGPEKLSELHERYWSNLSDQRPTSVVHLQEALAMVDLSQPLGLMSCECRLWARGRVEDSEAKYSCLGLGVGMLKWQRWPERYKWGVRFVNPGEAKEWLTRWNKKGMCHIVMSYGAPYIGGICNCDYPACYPLRARRDLDMYVLRGHYVAKLDQEACNGCGICVHRCQFRAVSLDVTRMKASINMFECFGCGVCETGCPTSAISLVNRSAIPAVANLW